MSYSSSFQLERFLEEFSSAAEGWTYASSFFNFLRFAMGVLTIVGMWAMFEKAGENGWGSLIPYYRTYLLYKIADMKKLFWLYLVTALTSTLMVFILIITFFYSIFTMISNFETGLYGSAGSIFAMLVIIGVASVIGLVLRIINAVNLTKTFDISGGYAVGIFFLPAIFYMIIGLSKNIHHKNGLSGTQGYNGQGGQAQDPYRQNPYQQNPYQQNPYQQNPYQQNPYQQNPYQQTTYQQNNYAQNNYQQNPYSETTYAQNAYDQSAASASAQNPYANPPRDDAWKTIYDDSVNNIDN